MFKSSEHPMISSKTVQAVIANLSMAPTSEMMARFASPKEKACELRKLDSSSDFAFGDIIGCGLLVTLKSATAKAANCTPCQQPTSWLFFTKNGEIFGKFFFDLLII